MTFGESASASSPVLANKRGAEAPLNCNGGTVGQRLLDQRLAIWTVLVGPMFATLALLAGQYELCAGFFLWVMFSRLAHASISWRHGRRFSAFYLPLQILSDWTIALTKIWVLFHPAKQNWLNRGARTLG